MIYVLLLPCSMENGVDEGIIQERIRGIEKATVTYVSLNYSRIVDSLNLRIGAAHADLKFKVDKAGTSKC